MKLTTTRDVTNHNGETISVTFTVDFSTASEEEKAKWALSNRVIAAQKAWRPLSRDDIVANVHGKTFDARFIGRSIQTREKRIEQTMATMGVSRKIARYIVDSPDKLEKMVDEKDESNE